MKTPTAQQQNTVASEDRKSSISSHTETKEPVSKPLSGVAAAPADEELSKLRIFLLLVMTGTLMFLVGK